jgi:HK97 family phage prohead protease
MAKYDNIDFTPPMGVRKEAAKGLEWRNKFNRGGTAVGVARARDLSNGTNISPDTARRMASYFARHQVDKKGQGFQPGEDGFPSAGRIAWALWGGDPGQAWANKLTRQMDAADNEGRTMTTEMERRCVALPLTLETRDAGKAYIGGYAAKYNVRSTMLGTFREQILPGAFTRALKEQPHPVVALWNHDPNFVLGSTRSGTLQVDTDDEGMRYSVEVPDTQLGRDLSTLIARGDVWGSSFAFVLASGPDAESWDKDEDGVALRTIHEVEGVYDVSPVLTPAYEQATTGVAVRSYERFLQSHRPALKLPALRRDAKIETAIRRFLRQHGRKVR